MFVPEGSGHSSSIFLFQLAILNLDIPETREQRQVRLSLCLRGTDHGASVFLLQLVILNMDMPESG